MLRINGTGTTGPKEWSQFVNYPAQRATVFDLNVVQTNPAYQLQGLQQMVASGVPIEMVELGNELWDVYQGGFASGASYRLAMEPYITAIVAQYPNVKFALVGHEFHGGKSAVEWNSEVFNGTNTTGEAHAATVHIYTIINTRGINAANVLIRAPELLASSFQFPLAQHGFLENTIPKRYRLWVTEMGHRARSGWLHQK